MKKLIFTVTMFLTSLAYAGPVRILDGQQINNNGATVVIPTTPTTLIGDDTTDTLTNKTIDASTNTITNIDLTTSASGALPVANGGTGATTAPAALNAILPAQGAQTGKYLSTNGTAASWIAVPDTAPVVNGSGASPTAVTAGGGVLFSGSSYNVVSFVSGSGGATTLTASPQIEAGSLVGQHLTLIGRSAANTLTLQDGNGLSLNGTAVLGLDSAISLLWDGAAWVEISRR